jgi:hypothetical protein
MDGDRITQRCAVEVHQLQSDGAEAARRHDIDHHRPAHAAIRVFRRDTRRWAREFLRECKCGEDDREHADDD